MSRDYSSRRSSAPGSASGGRHNRQRSDSAKRNTRHSHPRKPAPRSHRGRGGNGNTRNEGRGGQAPPDNRRVWVVCAVLIAIIALCLYFISRPASHDSDTADIELPEAHAAETGSADESDKSDSEKNSDPSDDSKRADRDKDKRDKQAAKQEPRFSFYKMLPNYRVEVEEEERHAPTPVARAQTPHEPEVSSKTPVPGKSSRARSAPRQSASNTANADSGNDATRQFQFRIQVGAFSNAEDAQRRRQELSDLGVPAQVQPMQTDDGKTIYRVQSDRLDSRVQARSISQKLENHGIETMIQPISEQG